MHEYSSKQMDPAETETAVGKNFNHSNPYAANSLFYSGLGNRSLVVLHTERLLLIQVPHWI